MWHAVARPNGLRQTETVVLGLRMPLPRKPSIAAASHFWEDGAQGSSMAASMAGWARLGAFCG